MGVLSRSKARTLLTLAIIFITPVVFGQATLNDVKSSFNQAVQMEKFNPEAAINSYENVIELADEVGGEEATKIMEQAKGRIPKMYYEAAKKLAGQGDYDKSVKMLESSIEGYEAAGNKRAVRRSLSTILKIRNAQGGAALKAGEFDKALGYFDDALGRDPGYTNGYLGKLLVYNKMEDGMKMEEVAEAGLKVADQERDHKVGGNIKKVMRGYFFNNAQKAMADEDFAKAESNLSKAIEYGHNNAIVHYQLGLAMNGQEKWAGAVESFNKCLELETGDAEDKAKVYFNLAVAYQKLGQDADACRSYKKSLYGEFKEAAQYQIDNVLECDG
ncbi:MAG: tetratricopeptide repeat protein [Bacteroidales bacterium]|nr:tetratricopeptide repeat protein [Bacteroidales bacterium]